ncbi:unnamed protein product [Spirodela intermedia]|uniref:Uncharacterized protein n=1 Tax=Spirodela intermedia TaxID=51605 RepID=A0A7I8JXH2_SPIIN|nr:unnamed protein product [Spirodela intermedia]
MGKMCCFQGGDEEKGVDPVGLLIALVIALTLMVLCSAPRRKYVVAIRHRC